MTERITRFDDPDRRESIPGYVDLHSLFMAPPHQETWIAALLVPKGRLVALVGPAKSGKSLLALNCAAAIASGRPFLGEPTIKSKVLYIDQENIPISDVKPRLEQMGYGWEDLEDNLIYSSFGSFKDFNTYQGAEELMSVVREHKIKVVIIDTISRVVTGKENDNDTWNELHRHFERQLRREGVSLLRIDHTGKDTEKGPRGGSAKLGDVDMTIIVAPSRDGSLRLSVDGSRMPISWTRTTLEIINEPCLDFRVSEPRLETNGERISRLVKLLDDSDVERSLSVVKTRQELKARGEKVSGDAVAEIARIRRSVQPLNAPSGPQDREWSWSLMSFPTSTHNRNAGTNAPRHCKYNELTFLSE